jgi:hypothetical protein
MAGANSLPLAMKAEASRQSSAQSMSKAMQRAIAFGLSSAKQAVAQWSHALAHSSHASMHLLKSS